MRHLAAVLVVVETVVAFKRAAGLDLAVGGVDSCGKTACAHLCAFHVHYGYLSTLNNHCQQIPDASYDFLRVLYK